ncbi:MAG: methyltransferase domain-containing protein [Spirochaetia bacterium]
MAQDEQVDATRAYYDSDGAEGFYSTIWGGEDLHIGIYTAENETIREASRRTVATMADHAPLSGDSRVLDVGAGYGGSARYLARTYSCPVTCLNLSKVQNDRNRRLTEEQSLSELVSVVEGNFEELPFGSGSFDVVWSQDAILHSANRRQVLAEVARVLIPGGTFVCTDPMQTENADEATLAPVLERLNLSSLASLAFYRDTGAELGIPMTTFDDRSPHLWRHYGRVLEELEAHETLVREKSGDAYVDRMKRGLANWVAAGRNGALAWGIMVFDKTD